jgi:hypothetical protein
MPEGWLRPKRPAGCKPLRCVGAGCKLECAFRTACAVGSNWPARGSQNCAEQPNVFYAQVQGACLQSCQPHLLPSQPGWQPALTAVCADGLPGNDSAACTKLVLQMWLPADLYNLDGLYCDFQQLQQQSEHIRMPKSTPCLSATCTLLC